MSETAPLPSIPDHCDHVKIDEILKILEEGKNRIHLNENYKKVTLVLGNTGCGKSTVVQWIASNQNETLTSKEISDSGDYTIENHKQIVSSIFSKTTFPELVITNVGPCYDCPGFNDTRSAENDIANNYFIKQIANHSTDLKIALVVNYSYVREGSDRTDFVTLLRRTTSLLKNIEKYQNSFGIIVTKVDNIVKKKGKNYITTPDLKMIEIIADFLKHARKDLAENLDSIQQREDVANEEKVFHKNAITMLDIFLKHEKYPKIAIFRRPDEEGPLSDIENLKEGKQRVEELLNNLQFTQKSDDDFGYAISDGSKNMVNALIKTLNDKVCTEILEMFQKIQKHYEDVFTGMNTKMNSFLENMETFEADEKVAREYGRAIRDAESVLSTLAAQSKIALKFTDLPNASQTIVEVLRHNEFQENIKNITAQASYYDFLEKVSLEDCKTKPWSILFQQLETFFTGKKDQILAVVTELLLEISGMNEKTMKKIGKSLEEFYENKVSTTGVEKIISELNDANRMVSDWIGTDSRELGEKIRDSELVPKAIISDALSFSKNAKYFACLNVSENNEIADPKWTMLLHNTKKNLANLAEVLGFLQYVYNDFSEYLVQKNKSKYNVADLNYWCKPDTAQGILIDRNNFKQFVKRFKGFDDIQKLNVTEFHLKLLNQVLDQTLKNGTHSDDTVPGKVTIRGDFVIISDLVEYFERDDVTHIDIFALNTVFIDESIYKSGLQLSIIAPKWRIIGTRVINLDGADGDAHSPSKANDGSLHGEDGNAGMPGLPGSPGGNFLGMGMCFFNVKRLFISALGGRGGPGQNGGDGKVGKDGSSASKDSPNKQSIRSGSHYITGFYNRYEYHYFVGGDHGEAGGRGGNGGKRGMGGVGGEIRIWNLDYNSNLPGGISGGKGLEGLDGEGGKGGCNGRNGADLSIIEYERYILGGPIPTIRELKEIPSKNEDVIQPGGLKGASMNIAFTHHLPYEYQSIPKTLRDYKKRLRANLSDSFKITALLKFLSKLQSDKDIQSSYDTPALILEFLDLEEMHKAKNLDLLPFYESLFNTVRDRAQRTENDKALSHVYAATLNRIITLKRKPSECCLIIDLEKYLNNAKQNIDDLSDLTNEMNRLQLIDQFRDRYKAEIDFKITNAIQLIESKLRPEIQSICMEVEGLTRNLLSEVNKKAMEKKSTWRMWINSLIVFGDVVSCIGSIGYAIGCVLKVASQIAESALEKNFSRSNGTLAIAKEVRKYPEERAKKRTQRKKKRKEKTGTNVWLNFMKIKDTFSSENLEQFAIEGQDVLEHLEDLKLDLVSGNSLLELADDTSSLNSKSQVGLDFLKYQVQSEVKNLKIQIQKESGGLPAGQKVLDFVDKLEDAMTTLIRIYHRIKTYEDQMELAEYFAKINSTEALDEEYPFANQVNLTIRSNLILQQHRAAVNTLTQYVFPFASYYLNDFSLVKSPTGGSVENLVDGAIEEIKGLHSKIVEYKSLITSHDKFLCTGWFTGDYQSTEPFFVWENSENRSEISELLSGEKVVLKADILKGILDKDAVKFNKIGINFNSDDPEIASDIRKKLAGFIVSATHLGKSYYKYGNKIYEISSGHQKIVFSFEKDKHDEPVHKNVVYGKIGSGDLMLSPYAMWEFQLSPSSSKSDFRELEKYNDKVNLELIGYGGYLKEDASVSDLDVETYYQVFDTL